MNNVSSDWTPANVHTTQSHATGSDDEIDLGKVFDLVWHRKWAILFFVFVTTVLGIAYVQNATPLYESKATLIYQADEKNVTGLEGIAGGLSNEDAELNSQIEIIRSRKVIGQVVKQLNLDSDPEFVLNLREKNWIEVTVGNIINSISKSFFTNDPEGYQDRSQANSDIAIDTLIENLRVSVIRGTHVFQIKLETNSPEKSADIVNTIADSFIKDQISARLASTSQAADWLSVKVADLGDKLAVAEAAAAQYRSNTERNVTEANVAASNLNLKTARGRLDSFESSLAAATGSRLPRTERERNRYNLLKQDIEQLEKIVAKQTSDLLELRQLDREAVAAGTIYEHFATRLNEIEVQKGLQETDIQKLSEAIPRYNPTKPKKAIIVMMAALLGFVVGVSFVIMRRLMDRSFNDPVELQQRFNIPVVGTIPKGPGKSRAGLLSYAINKPASALMESIRDMRTSLSLPSGVNDTSEGQKDSVILMTSSVPGEGKTTSSILLALNSAALNKKVLLVECDLRRSTFYTYFGHPHPNPSRLKPADAPKFPPRESLLDAVYQTSNWENAIWQEPKTKLNIIFGSEAPKLINQSRLKNIFSSKSTSDANDFKNKNAADIFASEDFENFIDRMRHQFDLIVLDCPPVLPVPDARLISKYSDTIIYVVHSGSTPERAVASGLRLFDNIGIKVDGLNLTQMQKGSSSYGYGSYGGYS